MEGILPTSSSASSSSTTNGGSTSKHHSGALGDGPIGRAIGGFGGRRKWLKLGQMDFELSLWQLTYLLVSPRRVYRNVYYHKQTKNQWARDDPAVILLISAALAVMGVVWSLVYRFSVVQTLSTILLMIFRDFLFSSAVIATMLWFLTNQLLLSPPSHSATSDAKVEWAYAFDVACNSFFTFFLTTYVGQLLLSPIVTRDNWPCLFVGNTLYLVAFTQYIYITYLGYAALPFLVRSEVLLAPIGVVAVGYLLSLLGFSIARNLLEAYFGQAWR